MIQDKEVNDLRHDRITVLIISTTIADQPTFYVFWFKLVTENCSGIKYRMLDPDSSELTPGWGNTVFNI